MEENLRLLDICLIFFEGTPCGVRRVMSVESFITVIVLVMISCNIVIWTTICRALWRLKLRFLCFFITRGHAQSSRSNRADARKHFVRTWHGRHALSVFFRELTCWEKCDDRCEVNIFSCLHTFCLWFFVFRALHKLNGSLHVSTWTNVRAN